MTGRSFHTQESEFQDSGKREGQTGELEGKF